MNIQDGKPAKASQIAPGTDISGDEHNETADNDQSTDSPQGANKNAEADPQEENEEKTSRDAQLRSKLTALE